MGSIAKSKLLSINLSMDNLKPGTSEWISTRNKIRQALEEYGCFEIINDVPSQQPLHDSIFAAAKDLFDLPTEVKSRRTSDKPLHNYLYQLPSHPLYESIGIENPLVEDGTEKFVSIKWPAGNPSFCERSRSFAKFSREMEHMILRMIFESYGVESHLNSIIESSSHILRFYKYRLPREDETNMGLVPHADKALLTIMHQHEVSGLQIKGNEEEEWIDVEPSDSSYIFIAGEALAVWTNDRVKPCFHQVLIGGNRERYSVGVVTYIRGLLEVPKEMVDEEHPLHYKPFDNFKYLDFVETGYERPLERTLKAFCGV